MKAQSLDNCREELAVSSNNHSSGDLFDRLRLDEHANPISGTVRWSPLKSIWWTSMTLAWVTLGSFYFTWSALIVWLILCALTLCFGHSLGMHRKLIHDSFSCPLWLEYFMIYCGTLVGLGGPVTMILTHDTRDWAQRQPGAHSFLTHQNPIMKDFWWQLHCKLHLDHPPTFQFPEKISASNFIRLLQQTSMAQQLPLGLVLYYFGGWGWVAWGICGRVSISIFGHWVIGYFAHNQGQRDWHIKNASVQGYNLDGFGLITFGECYHNNHHAFPGSAKLGLKPGQLDPGWWALLLLKRIGLVEQMNVPEDLPPRPELKAFDQIN